MILQVLIAMIAGWINRHQQQVIAYLLEENPYHHPHFEAPTQHSCHQPPTHPGRL